MLIYPENISQQQMYKLLVGGIVPRPIAWVSSISVSGMANLAPFSFFTVASVNPPVLCFNPMYNNDANEKDTLANIREQQEFVIHIVSMSDLERMNKCSHPLAAGEDEFEYAGIERVASQRVKPWRIADSMVSFECRLNQIVDLGHEYLSGHLVLGDVVAVHVCDDLIEDFRIDSDKLDAIGRMAGSDYSLTRDRVQLERS